MCLSFMRHFLPKLFCFLMIGLCSQQLFAAQKSLLIGIDGVQLERLQALNTPNMARLQINRSYTGGIEGEASQQSTYSGPGWATILTGTWVQKHQITSNSSGLASQNYPSIFKRLKQSNTNLKVASITHWDAINLQFFPNDVSQINLVQSGLSDADVVTKAIEFMGAGGDFTFVHLDDPDHTGHTYGFGTNYDNSLIVADQQVDRKSVV